MKLNRREQLLLVVTAAVGLVVVGWFYGLQPLAERVAAARDAVADLEDEAARLLRDVRNAGDLDARRAEVAAATAELEAQLPGRHSAAVFVHSLAAAARSSGAQVATLRLGDYRPHDLDVHAQPAELVVTGDFADQMLFAAALEALPLLAALEGFELTALSEGDLTAAVQLVLYLDPTADRPALHDSAPGLSAGRPDPFRPHAPAPAPATGGAPAQDGP